MSRLYVGNLSFSTSEASLRDAFSQFGHTDEVKLVLDRATGRSRGFAFISMPDAESARHAVVLVNGAMLDGRAVRVNQATERNASGPSAA